LLAKVGLTATAPEEIGDEDARGDEDPHGREYACCSTHTAKESIIHSSKWVSRRRGRVDW
jgi:hypothetical protein